MLRATERIYVTQSALSLQMKRLEEIVQSSLFRRDGRRLTLTPAGENMLRHAREILAANDRAVASINGNVLAGPVRVGLVQDFAETLLGGVLSRFASLNPETQLQVRVAGSQELLELLRSDRMDLLLCMGAADDPAAVRTTPMCWLGESNLAHEDVIPLAVLEEPCRFRDAALGALENARQPYRIVLETPSLSALKAAVGSGLGLTCRTELCMPNCVENKALERLPALPQVAFVRHLRNNPHPTIQRLSELMVSAALAV